MANLRDIKRRINSVKSTQKITRAMKMVAAAKLRRAQEAILLARPYAYRMQRLVNSLALRAERDAHPLLRPGGGQKVGLVVVTSDRGLCGGFNSTLVQKTMKVLSTEFAGRDVELTVVGKKGVEALRRRKCSMRETFMHVFDQPPMRSAKEVIDSLASDFAKGDTDEVYCLYNEFKSAISQNLTLERLLPFEPDAIETEPEEGEEQENTERARAIDYLYEPATEELFDALLTKNMNIQMHRILHESAASEHGARMTAMDAATQNASDVIAKLTLYYNRVRQDAITTQLIEVVSGAEAL